MNERKILGHGAAGKWTVTYAEKQGWRTPEFIIDIEGRGCFKVFVQSPGPEHFDDIARCIYDLVGHSGSVSLGVLLGSLSRVSWQRSMTPEIAYLRLHDPVSGDAVCCLDISGADFHHFKAAVEMCRRSLESRRAA